MLDLCNNQNTKQNTNTKQRYKSYSGRDAEISTRNKQSSDPPDNGKRHIQKNKKCVFKIAKHAIKENKNEQQTDVIKRIRKTFIQNIVPKGNTSLYLRFGNPYIIFL